MSTIKELAETCGVSEQAIRKWCARNQVAQPTETSCETSETMKEIIEMLRKELENCASHSRYFSDELDAQFF